MVAIVDYGVGNLFSLECSLRAIGQSVTVSGDSGVLEAADRIIPAGGRGVRRCSRQAALGRA